MELAHEAVQLFIRHETELVARTKRSDELRAIARKMRDPMSRTKAEQALRWNLIRESIIARSSVFVYFHECFLALIYQTNNPRQVKDYFNRPESPVLIDSSAEAFDSLLRHITTKYGEYSSTYNSMGTPITIKASEYPDMFPNWQTTLKTDMKIAFNIPHNRLVHLRDWYHVRINTASAKLIGFDISGTEHAWKWSFGPQSVDVDQSGSPISYYSILRPLTQRGGVGGWQEKEAKFPHPSLFSQGEILVCPESKDWTSPPPKLDLSGVTDVILCFECDGLSK
ncbi:hypothetical protein N7490_006140 [Penicillium lividum]|nr:hypothetical protein N7490_006140 [Penicillium lividum]